LWGIGGFMQFVIDGMGNLFNVAETKNGGLRMTKIMTNEIGNGIEISDNLELFCISSGKEIDKLKAKFKLSGKLECDKAFGVLYKFNKEKHLDILYMNGVVYLYDKKAQQEYLNKESGNINLTAFQTGLGCLYFKGYASMFFLSAINLGIMSYNDGKEEILSCLGDIIAQSEYYVKKENELWLEVAIEEYGGKISHKIIIVGDNKLEMYEDYEHKKKLQIMKDRLDVLSV
jgi:hypothetical protein